LLKLIKMEKKQNWRMTLIKKTRRDKRRKYKLRPNTADRADLENWKARKAAARQIMLIVHPM